MRIWRRGGWNKYKQRQETPLSSYRPCLAVGGKTRSYYFSCLTNLRDWCGLSVAEAGVKREVGANCEEVK